MKSRLFTPGPTPVPEAVSLAMAEPIFHHRTPRMKGINERVGQGLQEVFQTRNPVVLIAGSGTAAMETAVVNLLSPGDKALVTRGGKFGERWGELCDAYGIDFVPYDFDWDRAPEPAAVDRLLSENPGIKVVFTQLCETSTGAVYDVRELARIARERGAMIAVDAVSGLAAEELRTDDWGIDVVVTGSQKGLMLPPGLAVMSVGPRAAEAAAESKSPRYYFDLRKALKALQNWDTPFTPPITLINALDVAVKALLAEGMENVWARHARLAEATRAGVKALGLELFSRNPSNVLTAVNGPEGVDLKVVTKTLESQYGVKVAGGQGHLKGKIFRIAHLGYMDQVDIIGALSGLELALAAAGYRVKPGAAVAAAQRVLAG